MSEKKLDPVFTEPLPRVGVATVVMKGAEILLVKSKKHGKWVVPGGGIKPFEHMVETSAREILEETGIVIKPHDGVMFVSELVDPPTEHRLVIYMFGEYLSGELVAGDDASEAAWVDVRQLGSMQNDMTELTADALYKFSLWLRARGAAASATPPAGQA